MTTRHRYGRRSAVIVAAALAVAACGGDDDDDGDDAASTSQSEGDSTAATSPAPSTSGDSAATAAGSGSSSGTPAGSSGAQGDVDDCGISMELIEAAQAEGQVVYFAPTADDILQETAERFEERYDISVSANRQPTGDLIQQVDTAIEAGTVPADVVSLAEPSGFITWTESGVVRDFDIPNEDDIVEGLKDDARYSYPTTLLLFGVMYNSANQDEESLPTSWADFPEREGRIALGSPVSSGSAMAAWWGIESITSPDYFSGFDDTLVTDSSLTLNQLVLTGEADFAVPGIESEILRAAGNGEPLAVMYPSDGVPATTAEIGVLTDSPNPNAGELFAQWMMCPVQQDITGENGYRPVLVDSPPPEGAPDISELSLIPVDVSDVVARRAELVEAFEASTS